MAQKTLKIGYITLKKHLLAVKMDKITASMIIPKYLGACHGTIIKKEY